MKTRFNRFLSRAFLLIAAKPALTVATRAVTVALTPNIPLSSPAPSSPGFGFTIAAEQYTDAYGDTAQDELHGYEIHREGYLLTLASAGFPSGTTNYQGSFTDRSLGEGIYTYQVQVHGNAPTPYDRWIEGHEEDEHDNPEDPEEVTGWHWVPAHREVGFDWQWNTVIGGGALSFILGNAGPIFVIQPQSATVALGSFARFSAYASGNQVIYTWQRLAAGGGAWTDVVYLGNGYYTTMVGASSMLTVWAGTAAMNGDQFRCIASNAAGSVTSASVTLTATPALFNGGQEVAVTYLTPQQSAAPSNIGFNMTFSGHTYTAADNTTASDQLTGYSIVLPDGSRGNFVLSSAQRVSGTDVFQAGYWNAQSFPAGVYTYFVTLHALHPEPFDRWVEAHLEYEHDNPDDPDEITGQHWEDTRREIGFDWSNADIGSASVPFYLGVTAPPPSGPPTFYSQPVSTAVVVASAPVTVTFSASVMAETIAQLKWQRRPQGGTWADIDSSGDYSIAAGQNRTTLTITVRSSATDGDQFQCVASNAAGSTASDAALLTVHTPPAFVSQPVNQAVVARSTVNISFTATASGHPTPSYRWQRLTGHAWEDAGWTDLTDAGYFSGTGTATLSYNGYIETTPMTLRCRATNVAGMATSQSAELQIVTLPTFTLQPQNQTVTEHWLAALRVAADGSGPISYQWQKRNLDGSWSNVGGSSVFNSQLDIWDPTLSMNGTTYHCVASNAGGSTASAPAVLFVQAPFAIYQQPQSRTIAPGGSTSFTVTAVGGDGPISYWWQRWDGSAWQDYGYDSSHYSGWMTNTLTVTNATTDMNGARFRCLATSGTRGVTSNAVTLTVDPGAPPPSPPVITRQPEARTVAAGTNVVFFVDVTSDSTVTYQWRKNGSNLAGQTTANLALLSVTAVDAGDYNVIVTNNGGSVTSATATLTVNSRGQTIVFFALPNRPLDDQSFTIAASASSGLPVSFAVSGPATLASNVVMLTGTGVVSITASQAGNGDFDPATPVTRTFTVVSDGRPMSFPITSSGTAAAPAPMPSNEKVWHDVDGDGVLDEIIPANTLGFHYEIIPAEDYEPEVYWPIEPGLLDNDGRGPLWSPTPEIYLPVETYVHQRFYFDDPEPNYEYMVYGGLPGRDDRLQDWRLGDRRRHTAAEISGSAGGGNGVWETDQPLSSIVSASVYLIRFGKRPDNPNWTTKGMFSGGELERYYMADRIRFLQTMPNWDWDNLIRGRPWNADVVTDAASLDFVLSFGAVAVPWPGGSIPIPVGFPPGQIGADEEQQDELQRAAALVWAAIYQITKYFTWSCVTYRMQNIAEPTKWYVGRTQGPGPYWVVHDTRQLQHKLPQPDGSPGRGVTHYKGIVDTFIMSQGLTKNFGWFAMSGREQLEFQALGGRDVDGGRATNDQRPVGRFNLNGYGYYLTAIGAFPDISGHPSYYDGVIYPFWPGNQMYPRETNVFSVWSNPTFPP